MLRLAHRLCSQNAAFVDRIAECECILVDDVAAMYGASAKMEWDMDVDFPCLMPQFPNMFIEWNMPAAWIVNGEHVPQPAQQAGVFVKYVESIPYHSLLSSLERHGREFGADVQQITERMAEERGPYHVVRNKGVFSVGGTAMLVGADVINFIDNQGRWVGYFITFDDGLVRDRGIDWCNAQVHRILGGHLYIAYLAMSLMDCKNVELRERSEDGPSAKWLRRQKLPAIRYRVLDIEPMRKVLRTEGDMETNGLKKALHICRGHFSTYTEEKPLFGKYVGRYWVPSHTRGSLEHGAVVKDYRVKLQPTGAT